MHHGITCLGSGGNWGATCAAGFPGRLVPASPAPPTPLSFGLWGPLEGYLCCGVRGRQYLPARPSHSTLFWALGEIGGLPVPQGSGGGGTCQPAPPTPPLSRANRWTLVPIRQNASRGKPCLAPRQHKMASWVHGHVEGGNVTPKVCMTTPFANEPPAVPS